MESPDRDLPETIGRYRVVRILGQGAMGRVLLAHDPVLDRDVAVKLLRDDLGLPPEQRSALLDRMRQEARASARVSHPNIVALHDMGDDELTGLYLVFEYVAGKTLKEQLEGGGALGSEAAASLSQQLGGALTTAHATGVVHRDIKPDNIILAKTGAKIADFGIARIPDSTLTRDGKLLGTPAYSAPEAISSSKFSPASDQFSLAATLYEAISGRRAFPGDDAIAVASRISTEEPPAIAEVCGLDPHVDTVLARGLSKNPRSRFPSCEDFGRALAEALELTLPRSAIPTLPDRYHRPAPEPSAGRSSRIAVGGAAVGALLAIAGFQLSQQMRERPVAAATSAPEPSSGTAVSDAMPTAVLAERPKVRRPRRKIRSPAPHDAGDGEAGTDDDAGSRFDGGAAASAITSSKAPEAPRPDPRRGAP